METGSILIKESVNAYKMSDRVSKMFWSASARVWEGLREFIEVYRQQSLFVIVYNICGKGKNKASEWSSGGINNCSVAYINNVRKIVWDWPFWGLVL